MKSYISSILIAVIAGAALLFAGCQTLSESGTPERITVQYLTLKYIDGDADRAARVAERVAEITKVVQNESLLLSALREEVDDIIPWDDLADEELFLVKELMDMVNRELAQHVQDGIIPEDARVYIHTYLGWIQEIAALRAR